MLEKTDAFIKSDFEDFRDKIGLSPEPNNLLERVCQRTHNYFNNEYLINMLANDNTRYSSVLELQLTRTTEVCDKLLSPDDINPETLITFTKLLLHRYIESAKSGIINEFTITHEALSTILKSDEHLNTKEVLKAVISDPNNILSIKLDPVDIIIYEIIGHLNCAYVLKTLNQHYEQDVNTSNDLDVIIKFQTICEYTAFYIYTRFVFYKSDEFNRTQKDRLISEIKSLGLFDHHKLHYLFRRFYIN